LAVGFGGGLGADAQGEPGVGVTEAGLGGLEVDAFEDESGGVGPAKVVELDPRDTGLLSGGIPDPVQPVRVVEVVTSQRESLPPSDPGGLFRFGRPGPGLGDDFVDTFWLFDVSQLMLPEVPEGQCFQCGRSDQLAGSRGNQGLPTLD
jgi:hypothetical protein